MSCENWKIESDLCRCCHSEGPFESLSASEDTIGKEEIGVYSDMLKNCLDVELIAVDGQLLTSAFTICPVCAARLQDAHNFKLQVLQCEKIFRSLYASNSIKGSFLVAPPEIKEELPDPDDDDINGIDDTADLDFKLEEEHDEKKVKRKKNAKANGTKKARSRKREVKPARPKREKDDKYKASKRKTSSLYSLSRSDYTTAADGRIKCARCDKHFSSTQGLRLHVIQHLNISRYPCPLCSKGFNTMAPFVAHKYTAHDIDDRAKCNACDNVFNTRAQLRKHKNGYHMLGKKIQCTLCDYESFSKEALYKHKFKHKTVKDYHCKYCRKSFMRKTTLALHERIHTGDRRKVCAECGQAFVQKASLNYHMAKYHPAVKF